WNPMVWPLASSQNRSVPASRVNWGSPMSPASRRQAIAWEEGEREPVGRGAVRHPSTPVEPDRGASRDRVSGGRRRSAGDRRAAPSARVSEIAASGIPFEGGGGGGGL